MPNWTPFLVVCIFAWAWTFAALALASMWRNMLSIVRFVVLSSGALCALAGVIMGSAVGLSMSSWAGIGVILVQFTLLIGNFLLLNRWALPRVNRRIVIFRRALDIKRITQYRMEVQRMAAAYGVPEELASMMLSAEGPFIVVTITQKPPGSHTSNGHPDET